MAAALTTIGVTGVITAIEAALNAKGLITSTLYKSGTDLVFSTPLTSKIIRIYVLNSGDTAFYMYYGDSWTSGTTLVNTVGFCYAFNTNEGLLVGVDVVADTDFFLISFKSSGGSGVGYVGHLDNGDDLVFGFSNQLTTANAAKNLTTNSVLYPVSIDCALGIQDASANFLSLPLMWVDTAGRIVMNGSSISGTRGVKLSTAKFGYYVGSNYYLTSASYNFISTPATRTSLLVEFTP